MPQVDLSSVCAGGGVTQVACETLAAADDATDEPSSAPMHLDYAPESFWLSKDAELDWLDRNAFMERRDSGKASQSHSTNLNPNPPHPAAGSTRYSGSLKSKPSIIGLPKPTKTSYAEAKNRRHCRPVSIRLFPKRSESVGNKSGAAMSEPTSPKVSCMGRVKSRKDRSRKAKNRKKVVGEPAVLVRNKSNKDRKPGFWKNFRSMFRAKSHKKGDEPEWESSVVASKRSHSIKKRGFNFNQAGGNDGGSSETSSSEPPGLGGVKRFASGRRSDAWAADLEVDGAQSEPLDKGPIWRRRDRGPQHVNVETDRDWQSVGPASV